MRSLDDLSDVLAAASVALVDAAEGAAESGAWHGKRALNRVVTRHVGQDGEFTRGGGIPVGVKWTRPVRSASGATVTLVARGPAGWLSGTQRHEIRAKRKKALAFADGGFARSANHPGARDQGPAWEQTFRSALPAIEQAMGDVLTDRVRAALEGGD